MHDIPWLITIFSNMSSDDCSWSEVHNYVQFLNAQLYDCDKSPYIYDDEMRGFKQFVIKFTIIMAKVSCSDSK